MAKSSTVGNAGQAAWLMQQNGFKDWTLKKAKEAYNSEMNPEKRPGRYFRDAAYYIVFPDKAPEPEPLKLSFADALVQLQNAYDRKEPDLKGMSKDDLIALLLKVNDALKVAKWAETE
jgi:hypothetical protein